VYIGLTIELTSFLVRFRLDLVRVVLYTFGGGVVTFPRMSGIA
jgi:hypothetical protein